MKQNNNEIDFTRAVDFSRNKLLIKYIDGMEDNYIDKILINENNPDESTISLWISSNCSEENLYKELKNFKEQSLKIPAPYSNFPTVFCSNTCDGIIKYLKEAHNLKDLTIEDVFLNDKIKEVFEALTHIKLWSLNIDCNSTLTYEYDIDSIIKSLSKFPELRILNLKVKSIKIEVFTKIAEAIKVQKKVLEASIKFAGSEEQSASTIPDTYMNIIKEATNHNLENYIKDLEGIIGLLKREFFAIDEKNLFKSAENSMNPKQMLVEYLFTDSKILHFVVDRHEDKKYWKEINRVESLIKNNGWVFTEIDFLTSNLSKAIPTEIVNIIGEYNISLVENEFEK